MAVAARADRVLPLGAAAALAIASCAPGSGSAPVPDMVWAERSVHVMGTIARFVAHAPDRSATLDRLERMVRAVEDVEAEISTWREDSHLARANRQPVGLESHVPAATCEMLARTVRWSLETEGAFDPAIGSLIAAWAVRNGGRVPGAREIADATARAGLSHIALDTERCTLTRLAEATLDAGAFGKGAALDRARRTVQGEPGGWLVDFGGQIAASDGSWLVAIAHPEDRNRAALELRLSGGSLATSGGSERDMTLKDGIRIGHVLDPRTGMPIVRSGSATVWHPDALAADVLSTALWVMGPEEGIGWATERGIAACFLLPDEGRDGRVTVAATPEFRHRFPPVGGC